MTRPELLLFIQSLDNRLREIYDLAEEFCKECPEANTTDWDFQVAADIIAVFEKHAERK